MLLCLVLMFVMSDIAVRESVHIVKEFDFVFVSMCSAAILILTSSAALNVGERLKQLARKWF